MNPDTSKKYHSVSAQGSGPPVKIWLLQISKSREGFQKQTEKRLYCWPNKMKWKRWKSLRKDLSLWTAHLSCPRRVPKAKTTTALKTPRLNVEAEVPRNLPFKISKRTLLRHEVPKLRVLRKLWDAFSHATTRPVLLTQAFLLWGIVIQPIN